MKTAHLNESLRQRTPQLKLAVDLIADGRIEDGFARLDEFGCIQTVASDEMVNALANDYMSATPEQRANTLVLAGTNAERLALTLTIRNQLKVEGSLGHEVKTTQLQAKNLTTVQMRYTHNFEIGDVVMPTRSYKRRGLEKGELYSVVGKSNDTLTILAADGRLFEVDPGFDKAIYQPQQIGIAVGDRLRWTKNDRHQGRRNGQEFIVTAIDGQTATIEYDEGGHSETIDLSKAQHLDYALVSTTYSSQGKTADRVLMATDYTIGLESFYVAVSRAKYELKLYTEDKDKLLELAQQTKAKENPLSLIREQELQKLRSLERERAISLITEKPVLKTTLPIPRIKPKLPQPQEFSEIIAPPVAKPAHKPKPVTQPIIPTEAFWIPDNICDAPTHLEPQHWHELVLDSAIHPDIAALNFKSLKHDFLEHEHEAWAHLMYSDKLERSNTGRLSAGMLRRYAHIDAGGWWCNAGVDPRSFQSLQPGDQPHTKIWGCFKPKDPRENPDKPGKKIKYEHPPKTDLSIFLLDVPDAIANRIYEKAGVNPTENERNSGFWYCVHKYNLPVTITEGAKKAASLLSQGHAAIGLPGIYAGYRSKDEQGNEVKARLHDELAVFATPGREMKICFDYETRPEPKRNLDLAISRTGGLLERLGAKVSVVSLPGPDKGVDDLIVDLGGLVYDSLLREARLLRDWRSDNKKQQQKTNIPPKKLSLEERKQRIINRSLVKKVEVNDHQQRNLDQFQQEILEAIHQLNDQDFLLLEQHVTDYFHTKESQPPVEKDQQFIQAEIERLAQQINDLWTKQEQLEKLIESIKYNPFQAFSNKYSKTSARSQQTLEIIGEAIAHKKQFEQQLQEWEQHAIAHQSWLTDPQTAQMRSIAEVLELPQMQERLTTAKQEKQLQRQRLFAESQRSVAPAKNQQHRRVFRR